MPARNTTNSAGHVRERMLDLDSLERDGNDRGPFRFFLGGREYELGAPQDLDYRDLVDAMVAGTNGDAATALNKLLDPDDIEPFWKNKIPAFKMEALVGGFLSHYDLQEAS